MGIVESKRCLVSVIVVTYNHQDYIEKCLKSIITQKTDFDFRVIIADDNSFDETPLLISKFQSSGRCQLRVLTSETNLGPALNFEKAYRFVDTEYVALCEGDDYWLDNNKLQKQVDVLFHNRRVNMSVGNTLIEESGRLINYNWRNRLPIKEFYKLHHYVSGVFFHTSSVLFRRIPLPEIMGKSVLQGDIALYSHAINNGLIHYSDDIYSVYRRHANGVTNSINYLSPTKTFNGLLIILRSLLSLDVDIVTHIIIRLKIASTRLQLCKEHTRFFKLIYALISKSINAILFWLTRRI